MGIVIVLIALVVALASGGLIRLREANQRLRAEIGALHAEAAGLSGSGRSPERGERIITVRILNELELATEKTKAAGLLHKVRPQLLNRLVYDQAARELTERLAEEGVRAEVRVHTGH
ncbi:MAG: hypothetical protein ACXVD1_09350 [Nocardioides sp.]